MRPARFAPIILTGLAIAFAAVAVTGCGDSGGSTTARSTVPSDRLGASNDQGCPKEFGGEPTATRTCPDPELKTQAEWARSGQQKGEQFVVWTQDIERSSTSGYLQTVWCPKYNSIPNVGVGRNWGVVSTAAVQGLSAKEHRDSRGAAGMMMSWSSADPAPSTSRIWIVCRGSKSTFKGDGRTP
jgi:hypothetical protein